MKSSAVKSTSSNACVQFGGDVVAQPFRFMPICNNSERSMPVPRLLLIFSPPTVMKPCTFTLSGILCNSEPSRWPEEDMVQTTSYR